jgi:hypothetical protein
MTCGKGTETSDLVCPPASHPRAIGPNAVGAGKVDFSGGISQKHVPANFRMATMRPRRRCAAFPKSTAPAARENSSEGGFP